MAFRQKPECGLWTPTWQGAGGNPVVTYTAQDGRWQIVGECCFISCRISISAKAGGAGNLWLGGLPFLVGATEGHRGGFHANVSFNWGAATGPENLMPIANTTAAEVFRSASADARDNRNTQLTTADLTATALLYCAGFYFLA